MGGGDEDSVLSRVFPPLSCQSASRRQIWRVGVCALGVLLVLVCSCVCLYACVCVCRPCWCVSGSFWGGKSLFIPNVLKDARVGVAFVAVTNESTRQDRGVCWRWRWSIYPQSLATLATSRTGRRVQCWSRSGAPRAERGRREVMVVQD